MSMMQSYTNRGMSCVPLAGIEGLSDGWKALVWDFGHYMACPAKAGWPLKIN